MRQLFATLVVVAGLIAAPGAQEAPSIVIVNARVFTGVAATPWAEAVAITGERISTVGTNAEARAAASPSTRVIDAGGKVIVPGFNDAHAHVGAGLVMTSLDGPPAVEHDPSLAEVTQRLAAAVAKAPDGQWVIGEIGARVLDDPAATRFALDAVAPRHPVILQAWTGHGVLFNSAALRKLGVRDAEPDPPGGFYARTAGTRAITGVAHEYADYILRQRMNAPVGRAARVEAMRLYAAEAARFGITSTQVMTTAMTTAETADVVREAGGALRTRLIDFPMTGIAAWAAPASRAVPGTGLVTVSGTKWILDGTPVERLMFVREPYSDRAGTRGASNFTGAELAAFMTRALAAREQPMIHAVGDAAIDMVLDALDASGGEKWQPLRPRIEHGDMLEPAHYERARRFGVVLVQNPSHMMLAADGAARLGERRSRTWLVKQALDAGVPLAFGSDGPMNPFLSVTFATISAGNPEGAVTREQAVSAYTRGSAYAEFLEGEKGTIARGMLADLAMLSQDIFTVPTPALPGTVSVLTIVGGRIVHEGR
ncbi:MAG: amidohydrolase [Acidobacteriota bacterium]|nr:amidohydrolase [Acidobacteriota bacterium]